MNGFYRIVHGVPVRWNYGHLQGNSKRPQKTGFVVVQRIQVLLFAKPHRMASWCANLVAGSFYNRV